MTDGIAGANVGAVGWIGTGRMGAAMVTRLATAGVSVTVWNRTRSKAEPLAELGCEIADAFSCDRVTRFQSLKNHVLFGVMAAIGIVLKVTYDRFYNFIIWPPFTIDNT